MKKLRHCHPMYSSRLCPSFSGRAFSVAPIAVTVPTEVNGDAAREMWVIRGAGHQRSSATSPSDRAHTTSYPPFIETMRLSSVPFRGIGLVCYLSAVATISYMHV